MLLENVQKYDAPNGQFWAIFGNPIGYGETSFLKGFDAQTYMFCQWKTEGWKTSYDFMKMRKNTIFSESTRFFGF